MTILRGYGTLVKMIGGRQLVYNYKNNIYFSTKTEKILY